MTLLSKVQTLLNTWFPNKAQDKINFNEWIKQMITYDNGILRVSSKIYINNILKWNTITSGNDSFKISPYEIKTNDYSLEFKVNTLDVQIAVGDETGWTFACDIGRGIQGVYTHDERNGTIDKTYNAFASASVSDIWKIKIKENTMFIYKNDTLYGTINQIKTTGYPKNIRIYPATSANNIDYIKIIR